MDRLRTDSHFGKMAEKGKAAERFCDCANESREQGENLRGNFCHEFQRRFFVGVKGNLDRYFGVGRASETWWLEQNGQMLDGAGTYH